MKNKNISKFVSSLIYILMGLALIMKPGLVEDAFCYILAAAAILMGIVKLIAYMATKVETRIAEDTNGFAVGISLILLGLFVLMKSTMFVLLVPFVLGFMITFKGIEGIQNVLNLKKFGFGYRKGVMAVSVIIVIFGIVVMVNPFSTLKVLLVMLGIGLLASGVFDLLADMVFTRTLKKEEKRQAQ
ncbi:MAG: DUF308 domain-containing protein [Anaerovoracaceae bacterium]|nr:DUF308 domain-containing protein [Bacillota bacterium]MDY5771138.1 DUF308 domain-containing protein [Anaerovoracaceae bacterium]